MRRTSATSRPTSTAASMTPRPGGGAGMVLKPDVLAAALDSVTDGRPIIALTPRGAPLTQARVRALAAGEGVDPDMRPFRGIRRADFRGAADRRGVDRRLCAFRRRAGRNGRARRLRAAASRGNGRGLQRRGGELREGLLEYPHYTRPVTWEGRTIPEVLRSGDHAKIAAWRHATSGRRYTAKAAGPDRAPRGRIAGTALWRAATRYEG